MYKFKIYPLAGIIQQDTTVNDVMNVVRSIIEPNSWNEVGGKGVMVNIKKGSISALVIRQTQEVHDEIEELLKQLK